MSIVHDAAKLLAMGVPPGTTVPNTICPICEGGRSKDRSFSVSRMRDGTIRFNCFRDQCTVNGGRIDDMGYVPGVPVKSTGTARKLRPYWGESYMLAFEDNDYFKDRFLIGDYVSDKYIRVTGEDEYLFPIYGPYHGLRGYVRRQPVWKGTPAPVRTGRPEKPKALTFLQEDKEPIAFYLDLPYEARQGPDMPLIIVEDQVSAMRCLEDGLRAVALLGTHLNMARVRDITRVSRNVIIALDEDATGTAFDMARTWSMAFTSCRVAILEQDIKDMGDGEVMGALGL